ncbi:hypothetical protein Tco_0577718 [Tanacetum coccineum]
MGKVPTEMELVLEQTQQGSSYEVSVNPHGLEDSYKDGVELKDIKKDGYTCFQYQEHYEHVGSKVTSAQEGKISQDDDKRLYLADDLKRLKITFMSSQRYKSNPQVNDHYNISQVND